jgi:hypothetical protein
MKTTQFLYEKVFLDFRAKEIEIEIWAKFESRKICVVRTTQINIGIFSVERFAVTPLRSGEVISMAWGM